jgi:exodeoxyribonuclease VII large subunit
LLAETASLLARQRRAISRGMQERKLRLQSAGRALPKPDDMLAIARQRLDAAQARLSPSLKSNVQRHGLLLARSAGRLSLSTLQNRMIDAKRRLPDIAARSERALKQLLAKRRDRFTAEAKLLQAMSYKSVLARGFAVVRDADGKPIRSAASVKANASLAIEFTDGEVLARAGKATDQGSLF